MAYAMGHVEENHPAGTVLFVMKQVGRVTAIVTIIIVITHLKRAYWSNGRSDSDA
jgi:hypothetical protein